MSTSPLKQQNPNHRRFTKVLLSQSGTGPPRIRRRGNTMTLPKLFLGPDGQTSLSTLELGDPSIVQAPKPLHPYEPPHYAPDQDKSNFPEASPLLSNPEPSATSDYDPLEPFAVISSMLLFPSIPPTSSPSSPSPTPSSLSLQSPIISVMTPFLFSSPRTPSPSSTSSLSSGHTQPLSSTTLNPPSPSSSQPPLIGNVSSPSSTLAANLRSTAPVVTPFMTTPASSTAPYTSPSTQTTSSRRSSGRISNETGYILGGVGGILLLLAVLACVVRWIMRKKFRKDFIGGSADADLADSGFGPYIPRTEQVRGIGRLTDLELGLDSSPVTIQSSGLDTMPAAPQHLHVANHVPGDYSSDGRSFVSHQAHTPFSDRAGPMETYGTPRQITAPYKSLSGDGLPWLTPITVSHDHLAPPSHVPPSRRSSWYRGGANISRSSTIAPDTSAGLNGRLRAKLYDVINFRKAFEDNGAQRDSLTRAPTRPTTTRSAGRYAESCTPMRSDSPTPSKLSEYSQADGEEASISYLPRLAEVQQAWRETGLPYSETYESLVISGVGRGRLNAGSESRQREIKDEYFGTNGRPHIRRRGSSFEQNDI